MSWLMVALGGALGALSRAGANRISGAAGWETRFPWSTLTVNLVGCLAIGFVAAWLLPPGKEANSQVLAPLLITGYLGSLTTFSAFALQTRELTSKALALGVLNVGLQVVLGLILVIVGQKLAERVFT